MLEVRPDRLPNAKVAAAPAQTLRELHTRASALRGRGQTAEAAIVFGEIAALAPADWLAQYNAGAVCVEAGWLVEAQSHLERAAGLGANAAAWDLLAHVRALRGDMPGAADAYRRALELSPDDFTAHWGLFETLQLLDDDAGALEHQRHALAQRSIVSIPARIQPARLSVLELCVAGTFQANIPLDFLLDVDRVTVHKLYLGEHPVPELPPHDVVFNTIAEGPHAGAALDAAASLCAQSSKPLINPPRLVDLTARHAVAATFAHSRHVAVSAAVRANRLEIAAQHPAFPFLIRPLDSHAGARLAKIDDRSALVTYLFDDPAAEAFYLAPFIDYRNADGHYRKYRIVFVEGVAYPVHLAISPNWMIHYYNAPMAEPGNAWMRDEEHAFMRDIGSVFGGARAHGLREIAQAIPLDYFGIDCSIAPDGRVLLFEASTAMIVHMRDPVDLFPYKAQYVPRIIAAVNAMLERRVSAGV